MRLGKIALLIVAIALIVSSQYVLKLPPYETVNEYTDVAGPGLFGVLIYPKTYEISKGEKLTLEFELKSGSANVFIGTTSWMFGRYGSSLNESDRTYTFTDECEDREKISYDVMVMGEGAIVDIHVKVERNKTSDYALASMILIITGLILIFLVALSFRKGLKESSARAYVRIFGLILVIIGLLPIFLFAAGIMYSLLGVGLIIVGIELIILSGRIRQR